VQRSYDKPPGLSGKQSGVGIDMHGTLPRRFERHRGELSSASLWASLGFAVLPAAFALLVALLKCGLGVTLSDIFDLLYTAANAARP
jgi:hypothetical protein